MFEGNSDTANAYKRLHRSFVENEGVARPIGSENADLSPIEFLDRQSVDGTIVSFGGLAEGDIVAPKEFYKTLENDKRNLVFVKDFNQSWYQHGILGLGESRQATIDGLRRYLEHFTRPLTFIGTSAGGYAAIYFGVALGVERVISFCPQTLIDRKTFIRYAKVPPRQRNFTTDDPENDLRTILENRDHTHTMIEVFYSNNHQLDTFQAERIIDLTGVKMCPIESNLHNTAKILRKRGQLDDVLLGTYRSTHTEGKHV